MRPGVGSTSREPPAGTRCECCTTEDPPIGSAHIDTARGHPERCLRHRCGALPWTIGTAARTGDLGSLASSPSAPETRERRWCVSTSLQEGATIHRLAISLSERYAGPTAWGMSASQPKKHTLWIRDSRNPGLYISADERFTAELRPPGFYPELGCKLRPYAIRSLGSVHIIGTATTLADAARLYGVAGAAMTFYRPDLECIVFAAATGWSGVPRRTHSTVPLGKSRLGSSMIRSPPTASNRHSPTRAASSGNFCARGGRSSGRPTSICSGMLPALDRHLHDPKQARSSIEGSRTA